MNEDRWTAVDQYVDHLLVEPDGALDAALDASTAAGLPAISVTPSQGKLLNLLARAIGARRILELGTLGGYSTIWLARALPAGGRVVTIESSPKHANVARGNLERAGVAPLVDLRVGAALDVLPLLSAERAGPFDFIFIDADKETYVEYFEWAVRLARPGTLIVADNVVRKGEVVNSDVADPRVVGAQRFNAALAANSAVSGAIIQTVGAKGHDGMAVAVVTP